MHSHVLQRPPERPLQQTLTTTNCHQCANSSQPKRWPSNAAPIYTLKRSRRYAPAGAWRRASHSHPNPMRSATRGLAIGRKRKRSPAAQQPGSATASGSGNTSATPPSASASASAAAHAASVAAAAVKLGEAVRRNRQRRRRNKDPQRSAVLRRREEQKKAVLSIQAAVASAAAGSAAGAVTAAVQAVRDGAHWDDAVLSDGTEPDEESLSSSSSSSSSSDTEDDDDLPIQRRAKLLSPFAPGKVITAYVHIRAHHTHARVGVQMLRCIVWQIGEAVDTVRLVETSYGKTDGEPRS